MGFGQEMEPLVPVSEVVATEQEVELPAPVLGVEVIGKRLNLRLHFWRPFPLRWTFRFRRVLGSLRLSPRFCFGGECTPYC